MTDYPIPISFAFIGGDPLGAYDPPDAYNFYVGTPPYLDVADMDANYAEHNVGSGIWMGARMAAWTPPGTVTDVRFEIQARVMDTVTAYDTLDSYVHGSTFTAEFYPSTVLTSGVWTSWVYSAITDRFYGSGTLADLLADLAAGTAETTVNFGAARFQVSMCRLVAVVAGTPINQQLQRRDGLGRGGVPLARGNATRQSSNQARVAY